MRRSSTSAWLELRFAAGERPHLFWVSSWTTETSPRRWKVLSKSRVDGTLGVTVIEEVRGAPAKLRVHRDVPPTPAGWLDLWVDELASGARVEFARFDLRAITSEAEWLEATTRLGWRTLGDS